MRKRGRSVTDRAASSNLSPALTSTNTKRLRRRAMISISPTGLFQRRARMRKPLATRNAAARLSAEMPVRNAICRSGRRAWIGLARDRSSAMAALLIECESTLIDVAARRPGDGGDLGDGLLDRNTAERLAEQGVEIDRGHLSLGFARCHDDHHLAARLARLRRLPREGREIAATHLFVKLGELAADGGLARTKPGGKVGKGRRDTCAGLEQDERCRDALELANARAPCCFLCRQKTFEEETVAGQPAQRERREHGGGARHRGHACTRRPCFAHELVTGIGHEWCSGVRDQRDGGAFTEASKQPRTRLRGIVLVIRAERSGDAITVEKLASDAGVLACD